MVKQNASLYRIKQATVKEQDEILEHWVALTTFLPQQHLCPFGAVDIGARTLQLKGALQNTLEAPQATIFICELDQVVVGSIATVLNQQGGYERPSSSVLFNLWVEESQRRQGVAGRLLESAYTWLTQHGVTSVQAGWHPDNIVADAFWKKQGFQNYEVISARQL